MASLCRVADGILSVTPDTPEVMEWRAKSALDVAETSSIYLDDEDDGACSLGRCQFWLAHNSSCLLCNLDLPAVDTNLCLALVLQALSLMNCMESLHGRLRTFRRLASGSCAATCLTWATTSGEGYTLKRSAGHGSCYSSSPGTDAEDMCRGCLLQVHPCLPSGL